MDREEKLNKFLAETTKRPIPNNPVERIQVLARDLAEGATIGLWRPGIGSDRQSIVGLGIDVYLAQKWNGNYPKADILESYGYLQAYPGGGGYNITREAFDLLNEHQAQHIFISYKRSESSAFAMYVLTRLKQEKLEAFVDMSLVPGEDWHAGLEERIKEYDYLIALIGKETLKSDVCIKELGWAIEAGLTIIPVWHNGFKYQPDKWNLPPKVADLIGATHAIEVKEESASGYNTAMVELLNRFGITP